MGTKVVSNFWTAVIASVILTATALLLNGHEHCGLVLTFEGLLFGVRVADKGIQAYQKGKENPEQLRV
ncbi:MAG: hypothetical protein JJE55_06790 [Flavobacteriaceae bacterium]|nr:hypothetical protein [Flavobacteriaceae bacterium]